MNPSREHWKAVKCISKYLRRTKDMVLVYGDNDIRVYGYSTSNFHSDVDHKKYILRFIFTLNRGAVSWKSSKQSMIADSTTKDEYVAACDVAKEATWIKKFVTKLQVVLDVDQLLPFYYDNNDMIA